MRTGHSLTVCQSLLPGRGGGVCLRGGLLWGVSALGGVCSGEVSAPGGSAPGGGVSAPGGFCSGGWLLPGGIPACTEADPPVNRMTDKSKSITLATTSLRPVIKSRLSLNLRPQPCTVWLRQSKLKLEHCCLFFFGKKPGHNKMLKHLFLRENWICCQGG